MSKRGPFCISDGVSKGQTWATYRRAPNGSLHRVKSPKLPPRPTREEAEADLRKWLGLADEPKGER